VRVKESERKPYGQMFAFHSLTESVYWIMDWVFSVGRVLSLFHGHTHYQYCTHNIPENQISFYANGPIA